MNQKARAPNLKMTHPCFRIHSKLMSLFKNKYIQTALNEQFKLQSRPHLIFTKNPLKEKKKKMEVKDGINEKE